MIKRALPRRGIMFLVRENILLWAIHSHHVTLTWSTSKWACLSLSKPKPVWIPEISTSSNFSCICQESGFKSLNQCNIYARCEPSWKKLPAAETFLKYSVTAAIPTGPPSCERDRVQTNKQTNKQTTSSVLSLPYKKTGRLQRENLGSLPIQIQIQIQIQIHIHIHKHIHIHIHICYS